LFKVLLVWLQW